MQQDNDPNTLPKHTKEFIREKKVWPSQSPDSNPVERACYLLKGRLKGDTPPKQTTERGCGESLEEHHKEECKGLVMSMGRRLDAVLQAKDLQLNTKYYSLFTLF